MIIYEIGTGYTPIPARIGAATEIVTEELTRALRRANVPVQIIDIRAKDRPYTDLPIREVPVPKWLCRTDLTLGIYHKLKRVIYSLSLAMELRRLLKNAQEEVVLHFHNQYNFCFFLLLVPTSLRHKCRTAYTVHSGIWRQDWQGIKSTICKRYFQEALCIRKADMVFVLNEETRRNVTAHLNVVENRVTVVCNGVNTDMYRPLPRTKRSNTMILQVGSVCENKGQLRSVKLLLPLLKKYPDLQFAYAGGIVEEAYQKQIQQFAEAHNLTEQIRYLDMIVPGAELNKCYNAALATILPSRYEAFGMAAIESLAAGIPVLIPKESAARFGAGCVLYDEASFAQEVEHLLEEEASQLPDAARNNALQNYSWDKIAMDYWNVFEVGKREHV